MTATTRKNRQTGTMITIVSEAEAGLDPDLKWWTICDEHSHLVGHDTLAQARSWASEPSTWCNDCYWIAFKRSEESQ